MKKQLSLTEILNSTKLKYSDKIIEICKVLPHNLLVQWSCDCAESVLYLYEEKYPNDSRVRDAILAARSGDKNAAAKAAYYVTNAAKAAAYAAYAAYDVTNAAYYAAKAAYAAADAANSEKEQEELNLKFLKKYVELYESKLYEVLS